MKQIPQRQGYQSLSNFKPRMDEDGKKHCLNCDKLVPPQNRKYCSWECSVEFFTKHNWNRLRSWVLRKRNFTCEMCGYMPPRNERHTLVVDHIVPIFEGGDEFDLSNLQVLCSDCNKKKTSEDLRRYHVLVRELKAKEEADKNFKLTEFMKVVNIEKSQS